MADREDGMVGEPPPQYMIFLLVFFFFLTGLLGFLICHMLKKKGYRCRTGEVDDEEAEGKLAVNNTDDRSEDNQDTVEQILKCIIENEANMEAFKEMLGNQNACEHSDVRFPRKDSLAGIPPHHHTVHSGVDHNSCHLCALGRSKKARQRSHVARFKPRPGEQTVFSVGRFRVTHIEKKNSIPDASIPSLTETQDELNPIERTDTDKSHSHGPKCPQEGYNLRNMFKNVSLDSFNGVIPLESPSPTPERKNSEPSLSKPSPGPVSGEVPPRSVSPALQGEDTDVPTDSEMSISKGSNGIARGGSGTVKMGKTRVAEEAKDDMVEMEDIRDCRVSLEEDMLPPTREQKGRSVHTQIRW